jgi:hypothetical protein
MPTLTVLQWVLLRALAQGQRRSVLSFLPDEAAALAILCAGPFPLVALVRSGTLYVLTPLGAQVVARSEREAA